MAFGYQVLGFGSGGAAAAPYNIEYLDVGGGGGSGDDAVEWWASAHPIPPPSSYALRRL